MNGVVFLNGIDNFTVTVFQQSGFILILMFEYESRSIKYIPDINALLYQLVRENYLVNQLPIPRCNKQNCKVLVWA